jgi:hypothetical protein
VGPEARPVSTPDDASDPTLDKAHGKVKLPLHLRWSGPPKVYDLEKRSDRIRVYEQVLREGNDEDVRRYIDVDELLLLWDELVMPDYVRRAWTLWFRRHDRPDPGC